MIDHVKSRCDPTIISHLINLVMENLPTEILIQIVEHFRTPMSIEPPLHLLQRFYQPAGESLVSPAWMQTPTMKSVMLVCRRWFEVARFLLVERVWVTNEGKLSWVRRLIEDG